MPTAKKSPPFNLDEWIAEDQAKAAKAAKWVPVTLFGRAWRVTTAPNVFAALAGSFGDVEAIVSMIKNIVHPDERDDFHRALLAADDMTAEVLMKLVTGMMEAASGEHPTK